MRMNKGQILQTGSSSTPRSFLIAPWVRTRSLGPAPTCGRPGFHGGRCRTRDHSPRRRHLDVPRRDTPSLNSANCQPGSAAWTLAVRARLKRASVKLTSVSFWLREKLLGRPHRTLKRQSRARRERPIVRPKQAPLSTPKQCSEFDMLHPHHLGV